MAEGNLFVNGVQHHDGEPTFVISPPGGPEVIPEYITCRYVGEPESAEVIVWQRLAEPGEAVWDTPGEYIWEVPNGVFEIKLCMIGGGGSGACGTNYNPFGEHNGGGYAGKIVSRELTVQPGDKISITVGSGGPATGSGDGRPGTASRFDTYTAAGGAGGNVDCQTTGGYKGAGKLTTNCRGSFKDGVTWQDAIGAQNYYYGGQAGFANARVGNYAPLGPGVGGGGAAHHPGGSDPALNRGGDGYVKVSWGRVE